MKVIVLTGPESTGKTWLAQTLGRRLGGLVVSEYVREYVAAIGRDTTYSDVEPIARCQLEREDHARALLPELLVLDTHLLSNRIWSQILFQHSPDWLEEALLSRQYDLHLLLDPREVPWAADGQRCQPGLRDRLNFYQACQEWLERHDQPFVSIGGSWVNRERLVLQHANALLEDRDASTLIQ
ncbi:nicotinamide riboside kinase [Pseudomonas duriflava]|uniref:Nicotinamide riboside kinase n=1 Tax=Pseudomonas duriflava TaxID=459528 RepID=A0A562Q7P6_9PSED|nr:AAA family ATPase [Pseudomonas duriflava]TWI52785.1 nicotinamide riboside kinase [Pseudomonas duriflava]